MRARGGSPLVEARRRYAGAGAAAPGDAPYAASIDSGAAPRAPGPYGEPHATDNGMSGANVSGFLGLPLFGTARVRPWPPLRFRTGDAVRPARRGAHRAADNAASAPSGLACDAALGRDEFLRLLQREKRRCERSAAALSLVVLRGLEATQDDAVLQALNDSKRETDVLGRLEDGVFALLCLDTDARGVEGFIRKVKARAAALAFEPLSATYPDHLFDTLGQGTAVQPAFKPLLLAEGSLERSRGYRCKRGLDVVGALAALLLLSPLMLLVAAAIRLGSPGPVIFRQKRLGMDGATFTFYKFRSMVSNGDDRIHRDFVARLIKDGQSIAAAEGAAPFKLQADPRITRVGRLIRKTSIDELPQLFNVLRGDMSLVGPRPPIPYETAHYEPWHLRRILSIKPGITGLWQVDGRSRVSFDEMVRMDLRYVRRCSLLLDLKILAKTVLVVVRCQGAV
jgi:lipopolysaccharide/colanic/teichoic acid biosynthesis glycosyltransferase